MGSIPDGNHLGEFPMAEAIEDESEYQRFMAKLAEFNRVYDALVGKGRVAATDPELESEYKELMSDADMIKGVIKRATDAIDWVRMQVDQTVSVFNGMGNLGILPIVAWGAASLAMAGAIAYMSSWISEAYQWAKKAEIAEQMSAAGASGSDIAAAIKQANPWGNLVTLGGLALAGWLLYRYAK